MNTHKIIQGDCIEGMKTLPDGCVQTCITSPPYYGLRDYGTAIYEGGNIDCEHSISGWSDSLKPDCDRPERDGTKRQFCLKCGAKRIDDQIGLEETPEKYVEKMVAVFREVKRILRDDGTVWLNLGDSYYGGKGQNGSSKARATAAERGYSQSGGTVTMATRPSDMPIEGFKPKDLFGIPWRVAFALQADGWYLRQDIIWHKPNPMPESVTDRCTKSHEYIFLLSKNEKYYYDNVSVKEPYTKPMNRWGGEKLKEPKKGFESMEGDPYVSTKRNRDMRPDKNGRNRRSVWTVTTKPFRGAHFATYPKDLIEPCVLAGCPVGGTVFDPFTGSGTTAIVAMNHGRNFIGTELNPEYIKIAESRIANEVPITLQEFIQ